MAPRKKKKKSTRTTRKKKTTTRRTSRRRSKKDQERLVRELISVFFFSFGLVSLVVMYKTEAEAGYGLRQFLVGLFGIGGWFVSLACFYIGFVLVFPSKFWQRLNRILWVALIVFGLLGLIELPHIQKGVAFSAETTKGGIIGYGLDRFLSAILGKFLTGFLEFIAILVGIMLLTNLSLQQISEHFLNFFSKVQDVVKLAWEDIQIRREEATETNTRSTSSKNIRTRRGENPREEEPKMESYRDFAFERHDIQEENNTKPSQAIEQKQSLPNNIGLQDRSTPHKPSIWFLPPLDILDQTIKDQVAQGDPEKRASIIENTLASFGVEAKVVETNVGPTITQYALEPAVGVKVAKITALQNDLALALATPRIRLEAPIPGKPYVGVEVPNYAAATVSLRGMLQSPQFQNSKNILPLALGRNVSGEVLFADLVKMPHLLIAGATGSGKSVCINSVIGSLLFKFNPDQVKFIMVDPKVVELSGYNGIPHLLTKVITKPQQMLSSLKWAINEMERRYQLFGREKTRNIERYNEIQDELTRLPYIIIVIDELADLMLASPVEVEEAICRLAQKARATGIHLVIATQRPSVDVVTGLIKANIPARICFAVTSQTDSRVVLDTNGAEKLLGRGDLLYQAPDMGKTTRLQGVYVSDREVEHLVDFWSKQGTPEFLDEITTQPVNIGSSSGSMEDMDDELLPAAWEEIIKEGRGSASLLQRRLRVGYARAARIVDILESMGGLSPADGSKPRDILKRHLDFSQASKANLQVSDESESLFDEYQS